MLFVLNSFKRVLRPSREQLAVINTANCYSPRLAPQWMLLEFSWFTSVTASRRPQSYFKNLNSLNRFETTTDLFNIEMRLTSPPCWELPLPDLSSKIFIWFQRTESHKNNFRITPYFLHPRLPTEAGSRVSFVEFRELYAGVRLGLQHLFKPVYTKSAVF